MTTMFATLGRADSSFLCDRLLVMSDSVLKSPGIYIIDAKPLVLDNDTKSVNITPFSTH